MRRVAATAITILIATLLAGCRTVVTVDVRGLDDGSGSATVTAELDAEAAAALGGADRVLLDDLADAGWEVAQPVTEEDGGLRFEATRSFRDSEELVAVLAEVGTTADGTAMFSSTGYRITDQFGRTRYEMTTTVSVTGDPAQFGDAPLTAVLGGVPLGWTTEELAAAGATQPEAGQLVLNLDVPGEGTDTARFDLTGGHAAEDRLAATSAIVEPIVWALVALGGFALLAGAIVLLRGRRVRR